MPAFWVQVAINGYLRTSGETTKYDMDGRPGHPYEWIYFITPYCKKSQTERLGIVGVSFCQNFATCAQSVFGSRSSLPVSLIPSSHIVTPIPQALDRFNEPVPRSSIRSVHALHCQLKVQGSPPSLSLSLSHTHTHSTHPRVTNPLSHSPI